EEARAELERVEAELRAAQAGDERARLREERHRLLKAAEHPSAILAVRLLILTGCRRSEVLGLRWSDVDLGAGRVELRDSKTGERAVPLGAAAVKVLSEAERLEGNPFVCWGDRDGGPFVGIDKAWRRIRSAAKRAALEDLERPQDPAEAEAAVEAVEAAWGGLRLHDLRHSFASVGAAGGESLYVVGKVLGHAQAATTERYAHLADDPVRAAAERISSEIAAHLDGGGGGEVVDLGARRRAAGAGGES
ncbi:MAG: tyrosine-type recombinase/integrase, partial [Thermoanaerobaculia bacterium]